MQAELLLFCGSLNPTRGLPAAPSLTYATLTGVQPPWAVAADLTADIAYVYFELDVVFSDPVVTLLPNNIMIESGGPTMGSLSLRCDCMTFALTDGSIHPAQWSSRHSSGVWI